jgi:hypothetical protein
MADTVAAPIEIPTWDGNAQIVWSPSVVTQDGQAAPVSAPAEAVDPSPVEAPETAAVQRSVVESGDRFMVVSDTAPSRNGVPVRSYGGYGTQVEAEERLAELADFSEKVLTPASDADLAMWHERSHAKPTVTSEDVAVHDLIEDEIAVRQGPTTVMAAAVKAVAKASGVVEERYTLGPVYIPGEEDAHGEWVDEVDLQKALWGWVRKGDRTIRLQHSERAAGEMVEVLTWPSELEAELTVPGGAVTKHLFPAETPFMGVVWEPWAWEMVKEGKLRGYSIGGKARRVTADIGA